MFKVTLPPSYRAEREYIVHLMMEDFVGLPITIEFDSSKSYVSISADDNKELMLADKLFSTPDAAWLTASSLPPMPLKHSTIPTPEMAESLVDDILPVIFGNDPAVPTFYQGFNDEIMLGLDIFGMILIIHINYINEYISSITAINTEMVR